MPKKTIRSKFVSLAIKRFISILLLISSLEIAIGISSRMMQVEKIEENVKQSLINKGRTLVNNTAMAIAPLAADNAFTSLQDIIASTIQSDPDITKGTYMDDNRQVWAEATFENPTGSISEIIIKDDSISIWASKQNEVTYRETISMLPEIEFAAPVFMDSSRLGTIQYTLSTKALKSIISIAKREALWEAIFGPFIVMVFSSLLVFWSIWAFGRQADKIARPLVDLTEAASTIARGNYESNLGIVADVEVGELADTFDKMRITIKDYTENLEKMVDERTRELEIAQKALLEKAHKAGMADVAIGTLHNVGNILNSIRTAAEAIKDYSYSPTFKDFKRANTLIKEKMNSLEDFVRNDKKSILLLRYNLKLEDGFLWEYDHLQKNIMRLIERVLTAEEIVSTQQNFARNDSFFFEVIDIKEIINTALDLVQEKLMIEQIKVTHSIDESIMVKIQKSKLINVLVNLFKNASESIAELNPETRFITILLQKNDQNVIIKITDNGNGIKSEHITKIFSPGFTTKVNGHGYGLHTCANYMSEMKGTISAFSKGVGQGAEFSLEIPRASS